MNRVTVKAVQKLVAQNLAAGCISYGGGNTIVFSSGAVLRFESSIITDKVYRTLKFELGFNTQEVLPIGQDEFDGLVQAHQIKQNPFKCTIMCANPLLNEVN